MNLTKSQPDLPVTIEINRVVWNDKVLALGVSSIGEYESVNEHMHVTVATVDDSVAPFQSNIMLRLDNAHLRNEIELKEKLVVQGTLKGFL